MPRPARETPRGPVRDEVHDLGATPWWGRTGAVVALTMLVVSLLPWREEVFYTGGADPVVLAKAALSMASVAVAGQVLGWGALARLRPRSTALVLAYVALSVVGAMAGPQADPGNPVASAVLGVRVGIVVLTVAVVVAACTPRETAWSLATATGLVGGLVAASGLPTLLLGRQTGITAGRLTGHLLPVSPNQIAMLLAVPALVLVWQLTHVRATAWQPAVLVVVVGLTWLTGSRSGLLSLAAAVLLIVLSAPRVGPWAFSGLVLLLPAGVYVLAFTATADTFFNRGGAQSLLTLNSRTIAWRAALHRDLDPLQQWLGQGLSVKTVPVQEGFVDDQVLDSTWVSTFVQAGIVGLVLLGVWTVGTVWLAARSRATLGRLWTALAVYAVARSGLENGLLDTYVLFVLVLVPALSVDRPPRPGDEPGHEPHPGSGALASDLRTPATRAAPG